MNDHSEEEIGVTDTTLFVVPGDASVVLRCMALGMDVSQDRMIHAARLFPPLDGEAEDAPSIGHLLKRITKKTDEVRRQVPKHFILKNNMWPRLLNKTSFKIRFYFALAQRAPGHDG